MTDVKVIPGKEVALQHQLLVCDMRLDVPPKPKRKFMPRLKVWKLTDPQRRNHFQEVFKLHVSASAGIPDAATENIWNNLKTGLLKTAEEVCGTTRPHRCRHETWWWNEHVGEVITAKRQAFKAWKTSKGTIEHHTMQPNALPDEQCIMLAKKLTRRSTRILTQSLQNYTALQTNLEKRMPTL